MNEPIQMTKGARTRAHILDTAAGLFWRRSFHAVSMDELAAASDVNKATIYRYFETKLELAEAVLDMRGETVFACVFDPAFQESECASRRLDGIYSRFLAAHQDIFDRENDQYGCPIASLALEMATDVSAMREAASKIFGKVETYFWSIAETSIAEGRAKGWDVEMLARTLAQLLHGALVACRVEGRPTPLREAASASRNLIS